MTRMMVMMMLWVKLRHVGNEYVHEDISSDVGEEEVNYANIGFFLYIFCPPKPRFFRTDFRITITWRRRMLLTSAALFYTVWVIYPILFIFGPEGFGRLSPAASDIAYAVTDLVKLAWGLGRAPEPALMCHTICLPFVFPSAHISLRPPPHAPSSLLSPTVLLRQLLPFALLWAAYHVFSRPQSPVVPNARFRATAS